MTDESYCPHLGLDDGADAHFGYPSRGNRCWRSGTHIQVTLDHQKTFCLSDKYASCPIYLQEPGQIKPAYEPALTPDRRRTRWLLIVALVALVVVIALVLILLFTDLLPFNAGSRFRGLVSGIRFPVSQTTSEPTDEPDSALSISETESSPQPVIAITETPDATLSPEGEPAIIQLPDQTITTDQDSQGQTDDEGENLTIDQPDAYEIHIQGDSVQVEPVYTIPERSSYAILLDDHTITISEREPKTFTQSGPGYSVQIEGVLSTPTREDIIKVSPAGDYLEYTPGEDSQVDVIFQFDSEGGVQRFVFREIEVDKGKKLILTINGAANQITIQNTGFAVGEYTLQIFETSKDGQSLFMAGAIQLDSLETHNLDLSNIWDEGLVDLAIDNRGDGNVEENVELENRASLFYVPFVVK